MAIFGYIEIEDVVQVNDRTRINCVKSFTSKDQAVVTLVEIEPEAGNGFITVGTTAVSKDWYLDWQYSTAGAKVISLRITAGTTVTVTNTLTVVTEAADMLWSTDEDLVAQEPDILKWVSAGRNSFKNVHRKSQKAILEWLDAIRVHATDGSRLEKDDLKVLTDLKELSVHWTLHFIFFGLHNKPDDIYAAKAKEYMDNVEMIKGRGRIQADFNRSGTVETGEEQDMKSYRLVRR